MKKSIIDKPVIKTFSINNMFYVYDTYNNQILNVTNEQFREIKCLENNGIDKYIALSKGTSAYNDVILLLNKGYFRSSFIEEVYHPYTDYIDILTNRYVNELVLQVTRDCNFKCRYCLFTRENKVDREHEKVNMSWEIAKKCVDFLFANSADANKISISFYGGEPLLNFGLIKEVVNYANNLFQSKKIHYSMTVNGSLLNDEIISFLIEHEIAIGISLDGPKEIQNNHRKFYETGNDTFSIVYQNVCRLRSTNQSYFDKCVTFQPVRMIDEDIDIIKVFFEDMGLSPNKVLTRSASVEGVDYIYSGVNLINWRIVK